MTGLAALITLYVEAINTPGTLPNVLSAWETFVEAKCIDARNEYFVCESFRPVNSRVTMMKFAR